MTELIDKAISEIKDRIPLHNLAFFQEPNPVKRDGIKAVITAYQDCIGILENLKKTENTTEKQV